MNRQQAATSNIQVERLLWHGTSAETLESINLSGFNRSYCGKNGMSTVHNLHVLMLLFSDCVSKIYSC